MTDTKKIFALLPALLLCLASAASAEENRSGSALAVYETVKWPQDMPRTARVISAQEFLCKMSNSYDSYTRGYNDFIWWADAEIVTHMTEEDIAAVNAALPITR